MGSRNLSASGMSSGILKLMMRGISFSSCGILNV